MELYKITLVLVTDKKPMKKVLTKELAKELVETAHYMELEWGAVKLRAAGKERAKKEVTGQSE